MTFSTSHLSSVQAPHCDLSQLSAELLCQCRHGCEGVSETNGSTRKLRRAHFANRSCEQIASTHLLVLRPAIMLWYPASLPLSPHSFNVHRSTTGSRVTRVYMGALCSTIDSYKRSLYPSSSWSHPLSLCSNPKSGAMCLAPSLSSELLAGIDRGGTIGSGYLAVVFSSM